MLQAKGWSEDAKGSWVYQLPWESEPAAVICSGTMTFSVKGSDSSNPVTVWVWLVREGVGRGEETGWCLELLAAFEAVNELLGETEIPILNPTPEPAMELKPLPYNLVLSKPIGTRATFPKPCGCKSGRCKKKPD